MKSRFSWRLALIFAVYVFLVITVAISIAASIMLFLYNRRILSGNPGLVPALLFAGISIVMGMFFSWVATHRTFRQIDAFVDATQKVARGDFDVELKEEFRIQELETITRNFNSMTRELARTEILRNDFVENVSHEFKTPLAAIEGYVTLLQKKDLTEEKRQEYTEKILNNTQRLSRLSGNILLLSRLENRESEIQTEDFELDEQIRQVLLYMENEWSAKNIELDLDLEECTYRGNRDLIANVWRNLLDNAIKFSPDGGTVRIQLHQREDRILVTVEDEGPGISEEDRSRIFEKFYQADRSRSGSGNGLGLALVRRIVTLHGGDVTVESEPGRGALFTVDLPKK